MKNKLILLLLISLLTSCNQLAYRAPRKPTSAEVQRNSLERLRSKPLKTYKPAKDSNIYEFRGYRVAPDSVLVPYDKIVSTAHGISITLDGKMGLISYDGQKIIPPVYVRLIPMEEVETSFLAAAAEAGTQYFYSTIATGRAVGLNKAMGITDDKGQVIIPHRYSSISWDGLTNDDLSVYREINHLGEVIKQYPPGTPRGKRIKYLQGASVAILSEHGDTLLPPTKMLMHYQQDYNNFLITKEENGQKTNALMGPDLTYICEGDFKFGGSGHMRYISTQSGETVQEWKTGIFDQKERRWVIEPRPWYYTPVFRGLAYWLVPSQGEKSTGARELINKQGEVTVSSKDYDRISALHPQFPYVVGSRGGQSTLLRLDGSEVFPKGKYTYAAPKGSFIVNTAIPPDTVKYVSKAETIPELAQERLERLRANKQSYPRKVGFFHPFTEAFIAPRFDDRFTIIFPLEEYEVMENGKTYRVVHENGEYVVREQ